MIRGIMFLISVFFLVGCGNKELKKKEKEVCFEEEPSFAKDVWPIFESNCLHCHGLANYARKADGNLFLGFEDVKNKLDEGLIIGNIEHKPGFINMPYRKKKISDCEIEIIKEWVRLGGKDN